MSEALWRSLQAGAAPEPGLEGLAMLAAIGVRHREVSALVTEEPWELDEAEDGPIRMAAATEDWPLPATFSGGGREVVLGVSFAGEPYLQLVRGGPVAVRVGPATYTLTVNQRVLVVLDGVPPADTLDASGPDGSTFPLRRS